MLLLLPLPQQQLPLSPPRLCPAQHARTNIWLHRQLVQLLLLLMTLSQQHLRSSIATRPEHSAAGESPVGTEMNLRRPAAAAAAPQPSTTLSSRSMLTTCCCACCYCSCSALPNRIQQCNQTTTLCSWGLSWHCCCCCCPSSLHNVVQQVNVDNLDDLLLLLLLLRLLLLLLLPLSPPQRCPAGLC